MSEKVYAIKVGRKNNCICYTWDQCKKLTNGFSNAKFKSFETEAEAIKYLGNVKISKVGKIKEQNSTKQERKTRICIVCEKASKVKTELCVCCKKKKGELESRLGVTIPNSCIVTIKSKCPPNVLVFDYINENPSLLYNSYAIGRKKRLENKQERKYDVKTNINIDIYDLPEYILNYFKDNEDKMLLDISGDRQNPNITYKCMRCEKEFTTTYETLKHSNGHKCTSLMSTGEFTVQNWLIENNIAFKTQLDTLRCINPKTNHILPYDFELPNEKIIIEVQGKQHERYIEYFHSSEEMFEYQKYKDKIKKEFAVKSGYKFVEIFYQDFKNNEYQNKIKDSINDN